jgi:hypothetical protein
MEYLYLVAGLLIGIFVGTVVIALVSVGSYDRGYHDGRVGAHVRG